MKRGLQLVAITITFILLLNMQSVLSQNIESYGRKAEPASSILFQGGGKRWDINDVTIVYLNGTFYNMGYDLGTLLKQEISSNKRAFEQYYAKQGIYEKDLLDLWNLQKPYIDQEVIDYIQGCADALEIPFKDIACIWVAEGAAYTHKCSSFAAWGPATKDGKLIQMRSLEFPLDIQDPLTGDFVQDSPLLVICDPVDHVPFMYPTLAGYVVEDGINAQGIAVSNMWSPNNDQTVSGAPMGIRLFEALYSSHTAEEAIDIITNDRTFGYNFIVSDAKVPIGYAVETTAHKKYVGTWNDPVESLNPFWSINSVVRRTNCFLDPDLASTQRDIYNPRAIQYWLSLFTENPQTFPINWNHYSALSNGIEANYGTLDVNLSMDMVQSVYVGGYNPMWKLILSTIKDEWSTWWQWVACPETGEFLITFASGQTSAYHNQAFSLNFIETLEKKQPCIGN
jgi:hypothetical protein